MDAVSATAPSRRIRLPRLDAVPANHPLAPRFESESCAELIRVIPPAMLATGLFLTCFVVTDIVFYSTATPWLLTLRLGMIAICVATALGFRRLKEPRYAPPLFVGALMPFWLLAALLIVGTGDPLGPYALIFLGGIAIVCMLPWAFVWLLAGLLVVNGSHVIIVAAQTDPALRMRTLFYTCALVLGSMLFTILYGQVRRVRWSSFLARLEAQRLAERLQRYTNRLQSELEVARTVQQRMLQPSKPGWPALDVVCHSTPAYEVGGDFYSYHTFGGDRVAVAVGDISGKGLPAALLMSLSLASLDGLRSQALSPGALLSALDRVLEPYTRTTGQNCALCYADLQGRAMRVANAGGLPPLICRASGETSWIEIGGLPLGVGLGAVAGYPEAELALQPGDLVTLFSDGVVEARNRQGELLGFERLQAIVGAGPRSDAAAMVAHIGAQVEAFAEGMPQHDDSTIVVLRLRGDAQ